VSTREQNRPDWSQSAVRRLGAVPWAIMAGTVGIDASVTHLTAAARQNLLTGALGLFFLVIVLRLCFAAVAQPRRRRIVLVLLMSVLSWAAGSIMLSTNAPADLTQFPSPGELFFLAAFLGIAAYLVLDTAHRPSTALATWLEAVVICGGTACLAGSLLASPLTARLGQHGLPLLLALLYPLLDLALLLLVLAQIFLRARPSGADAFALCAAFVAFGLADTHFVLHLHSGIYHFSVVDDVAWGVGFALLIRAACSPRPSSASAAPRRQGPTMMIAAATVATLVLALRPDDGLGPFLQIPAVITLLGACGRLVLALREANGAAEAFALSRTDDLTLLPNRRAVLAKLDEGLQSDGPVGLMILDLDGFKDVNDTLGHAAGDAVLQLAADRMRDALPDEVLVARLGGDEFAFVVSKDDQIELLETAQLVLRALSKPLVIDGIELTMNASLGVTVRAAKDISSTDLLRRADVAMYQAKVTRSGALLYDAHNDDFSRQKLQLAEDLRKGIIDGQLVLWYQPQIDAATQRLCGLEALVRWEHPEQGLLSPALFLPAARRAGLMLQLSEAVGRMAVRDLQRWAGSGLDVRVAVNCAPPELLSGIFLPRLFEAFAKAGLRKDSLVIEVTEDSFLADPERTRELIGEIRDHHLQVAIDDYGTGFSSLSYLRDLPVQELKMDRSFIGGLRTDERSRMIVASTFQMAHALGLRVVAEGVEDAATAADLVAMGVDVLQGYHVARPMPAGEVEQWVRGWSTFADGVGVARGDRGRG
jgi:diguanylate cyclase (GGDEF)-like protein